MYITSFVAMVYCYASSMEKKKQTSLNLRFGTLIAGKEDGSNHEVLYKSCDTSKKFFTSHVTRLVCFDFTTARFGLRLPLPFHSYPKEGVVTFSNVREEQLAVLFQRKETLRM
ncbi:hypothetical protein IGI04_003482 [Brassica rapa subsp. trilocularis]|uniref:F-box associated beta-propeller type 1 domain-containing protein n=1 Tax=Brassica rapa subsp. trilocularis TaxID=1813537 RepID=A0ABQ7P0K2_BRACM|nr:hypothetical protein IGI04_003482 [Brassica rapa subsp. trilocularis]